VATNAVEELLPASLHSLGEPLIPNLPDSTIQAILGLNKIAFYPTTVWYTYT
jgi:hypothetical protein